MKKHRFLYLVEVIGVVLFLMGALFFMGFSGEVGESGETSVSPNVAGGAKQILPDKGWVTAVSDQLETFEYAISGTDNPMKVAYQAPNRAHNLRTSFSESGIHIQPRLVQREGWDVGLEIESVANGLQTIVPKLTSHTASDNRVTMDYGQWQAWYVNDSRGVEQGFTVEEPLFAHETGLLQINMAVTGDLTPQLVSDDEVRLVTAVGEQMLTYQNLVAYDAQGAELSANMEIVTLIDGQPGIRLAVDVAQAEYPIVIDPLLSGIIDWIAWIPDPDTNFGFSVSTAGDVNLDGFDDVLVGAHWFDSGAPDTGAVFGYYGGPDGLQPSFQWMVVGSEPFMEFGYVVNPAGDVNNDDFADVIIGTHMTQTGQAFVYLGTPDGLSQQAVWLGFGEQVDDGFGMAVNAAGDVNSDGYDDIIVGAPYYDILGHNALDGGRAYVFSGVAVAAGDSSPFLAWIAENDVSFASSAFGYSVGTAGDVDDNGFDDVIIGAPFYDLEGETGYAGIFSGTIAGLPGGWGGPVILAYEADWSTYAYTPPGAQYGFSVGTAGDVNQDGFDDVVVGAPLFSNIGANEGAIFVFTGTNPIGNMDTFVSSGSPWYWGGGIDNARFGHSVGTAGDLDQDGYDDIIAGAPQFDDNMVLGQVNAENGGAVAFLRGSSNGLIHAWGMIFDIANARFGTSVGTAGDVNQDGYADVIIGAPTILNPAGTSGEAYSLYGSGAINNLQAFNDSPTSLGNPTLLWTELDAGGVLNYDWDLGDSTLATGPVVSYAYSEPGYYTAVVTGTSLTDQMVAATAVTVSASSLIPPGGGELNFFNEETGFGTGIYIPPGAVSGTFKLSYTPVTTPTQPSPENSLGYYFDLNTDVPDHQVFLPIIVNGDDGEGGTAVVSPLTKESVTNSYEFNVPITMTIVYTDTGLTPADELELKLLYWNADLIPNPDWVDIALECGLEDTYIYYPDDNYYTVQVCHLSRMSVAH